MKKLMDKHTVIKLKQEGHSNREVAKLMSINRKTVARYWNDFQNKMNQLKDDNADTRLIQEEIAAAPKYDSSKRIRRKYTQEIDEYLDCILNNEKSKDSLLGCHKQKLTNAQIHKIIKDAGYDIGLACISNHIKIKREKVKECFIKQQYEYGDRLEYDFGKVKLVINGEVNTFSLAVLSSPASNFRWAYLYKSQKNDVFMDSHVKFFEMVGGIYKEVVYDNMKNVVSKFIGRNEKELNVNLLIISNYYGFRVNVTNCFKGNEKGHVEGSVKFIRNTVFAEKYRFNSYEHAREYLESELIRLNETSGIQEEIKHLLPKNPAFELGKVSEQKVNSYSFIQIDKNMYSVPDYLVGNTVTVRTYVDVVKVYANNCFVCEHKRKDGSSEISIDINHYLSSLAKKPGALGNSLALKSIPKLKSIFDNHFSTDPKKFIDILLKNKDKSMEKVLEILSSYEKYSNGVMPFDQSPNQKHITIKTKNLLAVYNSLCIGGLN